MTTTKRSPRTFDELLDHVPGLRRLRSLNTDWLRKLHDRRDGECTWCGIVMPKFRRVWCGDECEIAYYTRCSWTFAARKVFDRDRGICQLCGIDTIDNEREAVQQKRNPRPGRCPANVTIYEWNEFTKQNAVWFTARGYSMARHRWREVDHVVPVCLGGGLCGLDGLRLLCGVCHHEETQRLNARLARERKGAA